MLIFFIYLTYLTNFESFCLQGVANAADLSGMVDYLTELGIKHNRYGAEDEYFDVSISIHDAVKSRNH